MITAYHRPTSLKSALELLARPDTVPLGGGTLLARPGTGPIEVVDLQALGLNQMKKRGYEWILGAAVTLQEILESESCPEALAAAVKLEAPINIRNSATLAGTLVTCDGRSPVATVLLSMDARLAIETGRKPSGKGPSSLLDLGEFLPLRPRGLITSVTLPVQRTAFDFISRTPADKPLVCAALTRWSSGRTRLALGGTGKNPLLAMDGPEAGDAEAAARNAYHEAGDEWASAAYRMEMAATLARRCMSALT
jgi:CO/xanthine dehydrogenase FAD-binding subunit